MNIESGSTPVEQEQENNQMIKLELTSEEEKKKVSFENDYNGDLTYMMEFSEIQEKIPLELREEMINPSNFGEKKSKVFALEFNGIKGCTIHYSKKGPQVIVFSKEAERAVELIASSEKDPLTGLLNKNGYEKAIRDLADKISRDIISSKESLSFVSYDVNGLKSINDTFGHTAGDALLIKVANILRGTLRGPDIKARIGGDEFAIVFVGSGKDGEDVSNYFVEKRLKEIFGATMKPRLELKAVKEEIVDGKEVKTEIKGEIFEIKFCAGINTVRISDILEDEQVRSAKDKTTKIYTLLMGMMNEADQSETNAKGISKKDPNRPTTIEIFSNRSTPRTSSQPLGSYL